MADDLLITPGSRKLEIKDTAGNVDAKIETDASGNLLITNAGGDISIGDTSSDVFIGDGTNNVDIVFEQDGEIRGTSGVTLTLGATGSSVAMGTDLSLGGNDLTNVGDITISGNLTVNGTTTTLDSTNTVIEDSIIELNSGLTGTNTKDIGFIFERGTTGNNAGFVWDESADRFTVFTTTDTAASDTVNTSSVANFQAGSFFGNGANLTSLNASNISSGTINSARIATGASGNWWSGNVVKVGTDGVSEVGKYLDFHNTDAGTSDFDTRLYSNATGQLTINGAGRILTTADEGAGNGLDADTLDSQHGSYYTNASNIGSGTLSTSRLAATVYPGSATELSSSQDLNDLNSSSAGFYYQTANADTTGNNYPEGTAGSLIVQKSAGQATQLYQTYQSDNAKLYFRSNYNTGWGSWQRVFADNYHPNADTLTTARTIGGVSFNGSANINLPGVNIAGNQNTSGTAAGLSGTPNITVGTISSGAITSTGEVEATALDINGNGDISGFLTINSSTDGKLRLKTPSGESSDWNYIEFYGADNARDGYVGTDADGDMKFVSDKNSSELRLESTGATIAANLAVTGTITSSQISATTTADATAAIIATNTGGINGVIQRWIGDSDSMELRNMDTGDYELMNTQQNNGIVFRDGTGGVEIHYNGNEIVEVGSLGGLVLMSGALQIPNNLQHKDDSDTYIKFDADRVRIVNGGATYLDTNNGSAVLHTGSGLNASNLTSGTVPSARLSLSASDIPSLDASKITSGRIGDARMSTEYSETRIGQSSHSLVSFTSQSDYSKRAGYSTMMRGTTTNASVVNTPVAQNYWFYNVHAKRDTGGGTAATLIGYDGTNDFYSGFTSTSGGAFTWAKHWTDRNDGASSGLDADLLDAQHGSYYLNYNNFTNTPTIPTNNNQLTNGAGYATTSYVDTSVSNLVDSAPGTLNTLNELAAALGDDANFSTTVTNSIATKMPLAGGTFTGGITSTQAGDAITISSAAPQIKFNDTTSGEDDFWIHVNSNNFYILVDRDGNGSWDSPHPLQLEGDTNIGYLFGQRIFNEAYHPNADTWTTARTITLGGDLSGSVSINGSANVTLTATVADDSHNHIISNVDGLQTALDAKMPLSGGTFTGAVTIQQSGTPILTLYDNGNAGGGGASAKILFSNTGGNAMGIGYTGNSTADSDMIISTNAAGTYGGYLSLAANGITDSSADIILEPKGSVRIAGSGNLQMGTTTVITSAGNWVGGGNISEFTNDSGYITASNSAITNKLPLAGGTMTGTINAGGGINGLTLSNGISGNNFNITGVNQLSLNDPGEGILFGANCNLYLLDDANDNILRLDAPGGFRLHNGPLSIGTTTVIDTSRNLTNIGTISSGNIEVGTSDTTNGTLTIHGGATGNAEGGELRLQTAADYDGTYDFYRLDVINDDFRIGRQGQTDFYVFQDGLVKAETDFQASNNITVGTGSNSPNLIINKATTGVGSLLFNNGGGTKAKIILDANEHLRFYTGSTNAVSERLTILEGGNVGINDNNPGTTLDVGGTIRCNNEIQFVDDTMRIFKSSNTMTFRTNSANRMTLDGNGVLKIGSSAQDLVLPVDIVTGGGELLYDAVSNGSGTDNKFMVGHIRYTNSGSSAIQFIKQNFSGMGGSIEFYCSPALTTLSTTATTHKMAYLGSTGDFGVDGDLIAYSTQTGSDIKLKENIRDLEGSLDKTLKLRGVKYDWKEEKRPNDQIGFIAQEVQEIVPEVVDENQTLTKEGETHLTVNYPALVPMLVEAIKEQQTIINRLEERLNSLENKGEE